MVLGKPIYNDLNWYLENVRLKHTNEISYLGVLLSNNSSAHCNARIKAARKAFYSLQNTGLCTKYLNTDSSLCVYNTAIHPVLLYGLECVYRPKLAMGNVEKLQSKLLKTIIGLKSFSRSTPLLQALRTPHIKDTIAVKELKLLRNMFVSSSRSRYFYNYLLSLYLGDFQISNKCLLSRVINTCSHYDLSLVNTLCDPLYVKCHKSRVIQFENDGLTDSINYLIRKNTTNSNMMLHLLLSPF